MRLHRVISSLSYRLTMETRRLDGYDADENG